MTGQAKEIIHDYLDRQEGDFANRTLARKIVAENPGIFRHKDIERVRSLIRTRRGANGDHHRKNCRVDERFVRDEMKPSEYMRQFISRAMPEPERDWFLPAEIRKPLVLSDMHIPYHSESAIEIALDYGFKNGIDAIYLNGDIIDFYQLSRWRRDPTMPRARVEIEQVGLLLEGLVGLGLPVFYKIGNHEERWNNYLLEQAPELSDLEPFKIKSVLGLDELGIELIASRQKAQFGKLTVIHGHEFGQSFFNPVNPARGLFLRAKTSALAGHNHQKSTHSEANLNGKQMVCHSTGCLCGLSPDYRPFAYTKWNHGAAIVEIDNGYFSVDNFEIVDGRVSR
jgi:predicted phosphodiesterase